MVDYVSKRDRKRRLLIISISSSLVALLAGVVIGHRLSPSMVDTIASNRTQASLLATRVAALEIEYEQATSGNEDTIADGVLKPMEDILILMKTLIAKSPWLTVRQIASVNSTMSVLHQSASDSVNVEKYNEESSLAVQSIRENWGDLEGID